MDTTSRLAIKQVGDKMNGVYQIKNNVNGKVYIGSSVNIARRKKYHLQRLRRGIHDNYNLQEDFNTFGKDVFEFMILETVEDKSIIRDLEQNYIDQNIDHLYNICLNSNSSKGVTRRPETIERVKMATTGSNNGHYGKKHSNEFKDNLSKARLGDGNPNSKLKSKDIPEIRKLISDGLTNSEIADIYNVDKSSISKIRTGKAWGHV